MKKIYTILIFLSFFYCKPYCQSVLALPDVIPATEQTDWLQEKLFVHTDKIFYVAGEIIWFKIYCVEASSLKPLDLSKVAYIELLDSTQKPAVQAKIQLQNGNGNGSFSLPFTLSSGNYRLRAYTSWMKNGEAIHFFEMNVTIINVQKLTVDDNKMKKEMASVSFFPEGGSLVNNIKSRIAFKMQNQQGKGIRCRGVLWDGNDSVLSFTDHQSGIGDFYFTPVKNHVYTAKIKTEKGIASSQTLPAAEEQGFTMTVEGLNNKNLSINIETSGIAAQPVYLVIHKNRKTILAKETALQSNKASFNIDTTLLPSGVSTITLFNSEKQPVCERLFYKKYSQDLTLNLNLDNAVYDIRKKVTIGMRTNDKAFGSNDSASLSMSVYRVDSLQNSDNILIDTYLTLTSELKEYGNYQQNDFDEQNKEDGIAIDELMMVNGWRKFNAGKASEAEPAVLSFVPEYRGHIITGHIINNITRLPQINTNVYLSLPKKGKQFFSAVSDSLGNIQWETGNWYGDAKLVAQTENKDSAYTVAINDPFSRISANSPMASFALPYSNPRTLLQHSISMQTTHIYLENEMNKMLVSATDSTPFFISADKTYRLDDYSRFTTMEEVLREYIALVNVTKKKGSYHFPVYDLSGEKMFDDDPLVLVDGIPFFNLDSFIAIDPLKLKKMDVVNRRYLYGNAVFDGILNWQTYSGDAAGIDIDPRAVTINYEGLQEKREFYSPSYETEEQLNSHLPDFRNTLYWNANINLKGNEAKQISFYTSDLPGKYVVVVQGAGSNGLCSATATFEAIKK